MRAKPEYRDRSDVDVAVLDALADRPTEGMTVFELRAEVGASIDEIESALERLDADDLIEVSREGSRTVVVPDDRVVGPAEAETDVFDRLRRRLPF